jgi:peptidoglycan hydrolase-like protein with peptidoglycan-binding domain
MRRTSLFAAAIALAVMCTPVLSDTAYAQKRLALVIGNSAYKNVPALPNPTRDAKAMAEKFRESGFAVIKANYDLGYLDFKRAIRDFEDAAADADIIVVYYAGHGIEVDGINYIIPVDARLASTRDAQDEAVTLDRLLEASEGAKQLSLVILDACRDNPFVRMKPKRTAAMMRSVKVNAGMGGVEPVTSNTLIYYAARKNSGAEDGTGEHSPFTSALLKHLFTPGQDIRFAFGKVRDDVRKETESKQEPYVTGTFGSTLISLNPAPAPAAAEAKPVDLEKIEKDHYELVKEVGSVKAWKVFLLQHPNGFYAGLAKEQIDKLEKQEKEKLAAVTPEKLPGKPESTTEEQRAWDRIKESGNPVWFEDFIKRYPTSPLADVAQTRLDAIRQQAREREEKARQEREAKISEEARQKAEREAALKRAEEERKAKATEAARQKAERDAALKRGEEERLAKLAAEEARKKAEREEARKREEEERQTKAAEAARLKAEREAALKVEDEERRARAATEAERLRLDKEAAAKRAEEERQAKAVEAARLKAEREAALKRAEEEKAAKAAAEAERVKIEREAALRRAEEEKATKAAENERLKAEREAALRRTEEERKRAEDERKAKMELVRSAQTELARLGCYSGTPDGNLGPGTREALNRYQTQRGNTPSNLEITDGFVSELKLLSERICVAAQPPASVPTPVVRHEPAEKVRPAKEEEPKPTRRANREEQPRRANREEQPRRASREEPRRTRPTREASTPRYGGGGGGGHGPIGVGF